MFFSERKKLAEEYEKWVSENKDVLDCPLTVISWLVAEGYVGKTKVADLEAKLAESEKPKEIRFNGFVIDCNYDEARNNLQKEILKMQEENNELRKSQELQTYAQNILEIKQLKQQLAEKDAELKKEKGNESI